MNPMLDWIEILQCPLSVLDAVRFVSDESAGGIDVFLGTTRDEADDQGRRLLALDYEAYLEMAQNQLKDIAHRARQRWPIVKLALLHRVGRVEIAEPSVLIAVSTPHRAESFEACRFIIDTLKADAAIWKKEVWEGGEDRWVHPTVP